MAGLILLTTVCVLTTLASLVSSQATDASSHCSYLISAASRYQPNAAAFKIYTRSRSPRINSGDPVEVTIGPFSNSLNFFNFTDFILYATPANTANLEIEFVGPTSPHVGVFQLFDKWRAGASGMNCNPRSRSDDSVGAFEDRLLATFKQYYPHNPMLMRYRAPARNQVSVLWWPTREALMYPEIKFVANIKSMGNWFKLQSTPWKVNRPVDQWAITEGMLTQYQALHNNMKAIERRLEQPL